jgi:hypothetical protein
MREYLGSIFTDVASIIVGDPCKILMDKRSPPKLTYDQFIERLVDSQQLGIAGSAVKFGNDAITINTLYSCDGWIAVYAERNKAGEITKLVIDLNAKVEGTKGTLDKEE